MQKLDLMVIRSAQHDLRKCSTAGAGFSSACSFFFPDGMGVDEKDEKTFTAICQRNGINADVIAKHTFQSLTPMRSEAVREWAKSFVEDNRSRPQVSQ